MQSHASKVNAAKCCSPLFATSSLRVVDVNDLDRRDVIAEQLLLEIEQDALGKVFAALISARSPTYARIGPTVGDHTM